MKPRIIGIAGGTGAGKSTIASRITESVANGSTVVIDHDAYYKDPTSLTLREREQQNYDHPDSLDNALLVRHLDALRAGRAIDAPLYDFKTHARRAETRRIEPVPVIIVEGILVFVDPELRQRLDVKIFVDTDADIRVLRRIRRDMEHRGRSFQQIRDQYYATVRPMHLQFVEPSKRWADLIIPEGGGNDVALDLLVHMVRSVVGSLPA